MAHQAMEAAAGVADPHLELNVDITGQTRPEEELSQEDAVGLAQNVEEAVQEYLADTEEVWEFNPMVRIVPSKYNQGFHPDQGNVVRKIPEAAVNAAIGIVTAPVALPNTITMLSSLDAPVVEVSDLVILPDQLPGNVVKVLSKSGNTLNSSRLHCLCDNGIKCNIGYRHLVTLLGREEVLRLLTTLVA